MYDTRFGEERQTNKQGNNNISDKDNNIARKHVIIIYNTNKEITIGEQTNKEITIQMIANNISERSGSSRSPCSPAPWPFYTYVLYAVIVYHSIA